MLPVVCVINLSRDAARWNKISTALERQSFQVVRISAIDGRRKRTLMKSVTGEHHYSQAMNRNMTPGECACVLSHVAALKRIIRHGHSHAIVMEDDAAMDQRFKAFVERDLEAYLSKCDVVKIEGIEGVPRKGLVLEQSSGTSLILPFVPTQGSAAYAVTRKGAQRLMEKFQGLTDPVDFMLSFYERHGCTYGEVRPLLVRQESPAGCSPSNIEMERLVAYSDVVEVRNTLQRATEVIVHDICRRVWRVMTIALYALRFRTVLISAR